MLVPSASGPQVRDHPGMTDGTSTAETLWIALAGGAIGVALTGLTLGIVKLLRVPSQLRRHDFEARILNEDLELWAIDTYREVQREMRRIENTPKPGWIYTGAYGNARSYVKTDALHKWRDRLHVAEREMIEIEARENFFHRLERRLKGRGDALRLRAAEAVEPIIEEFRQPVTKHGTPSIQPFDPTRVKLSDVIAHIREIPLEPAEGPTVTRESDGGGGMIERVENKPDPASEDIPGLSGPMPDNE